MILKGKVRRLGDNIDTDAIIPARYLNTSDPRVLAKHCFEDIDIELIKEISPGDILVAGRNFGCGSSREHAPRAIKAAGFSCIIALSFARIFYRNAFNTGLPVLECAQANEIAEESMLEVNIERGEIKNLSSGRTYRIKPIPTFMREVLASGGLMSYISKKI